MAPTICAWSMRPPSDMTVADPHALRALEDHGRMADRVRRIGLEGRWLTHLMKMPPMTIRDGRRGTWSERRAK